METNVNNNLNNNLNVNQEIVQPQNNYVSDVENFKYFIENLEKIIKETLFENLDDVDYVYEKNKKLVLEYKNKIVNFLNSIKGFDISKLKYFDFLKIEKLLIDIKAEKVFAIIKNLKDYRVRDMFSINKLNNYILKNLRELCNAFEDLIFYYKKYLVDFQKEEREKEEQAKLEEMKMKEKKSLNIISNFNEESKIKREESSNKLNKIKTDDIGLNNEEFALKNTEIFKKKPILIDILEDVGIIKPEMVYYYDFAFDENGEELPVIEKLKKLELRLDIINKKYKEKIKRFREKLEKNFISNEDRNKHLSKNDILKYFSDFKIKIEKYDDDIKYLSNLRFKIVKEVELFEKNFKKEKNKDNINLKIFLVTLKSKLKELLRKDEQNLKKLVEHFYCNYVFFRTNKKYDEELLRIEKEFLNVYLKYIINSYEKFLYGLDKNKNYLNLNKAYEVKDKNKRKEKDIFEKTVKKLEDKKRDFEKFIPINGPDSRFF